MCQLFSIEEVAEKLSVCRRTVIREIHRQRLGSIKVGRHIRIREDELRRYMEQGSDPAWAEDYAR